MASRPPRVPRLRLEPFSRRDFDWLIARIDSAESMLLWSGEAFRFPLTRPMLEAHLSLTRRSSPQYRFYRGMLGEEREPAAYGELSRITRHSAFLSRILVRADRRGQGLGRELMELILGEAFEKFRVHRVELNVFSFNQAAIRCYESVGLKKEGLMRDVTYTGREYWSQYRMAILEDEWRASG